MPEAVQVYASRKDNLTEAFSAVRKYQNQLVFHYEHDFAKYAGNVNARHIERLFKAVPYQLSLMQEGNAAKFRFKKVNANDHPAIPLLAGVIENKFKLFLFDAGLLGAINRLSPESIMQYDYGTFKGHFAENFVLQELYAPLAIKVSGNKFGYNKEMKTYNLPLYMLSRLSDLCVASSP